MRKQIIIPLLIIIFISLVTFFAVLYSKGYRFLLGEGKPIIVGTGMLVATSNPDGAQVFVNNHLTTATNNTINLAPGKYTVEITKDGYFPWKKEIKISEQVVAKAEAFLLPKAPRLESITADGVSSPLIDPSFTKLAYHVSSQSAKRNGIYVLDMNARQILTLQGASNQIANDLTDSFSESQLSWSPDGKELIATISPSLNGSPTTYLLNASELNDNPRDVTEILSLITKEWENEKTQKEKARLATLKPSLKKLISENFNILSWSPDDAKILYSASKSAEIPIIIKPRIIGFDATPEQRAIEKDSLYIYDIKEDKNYELNLNFELLTLALSKREGLNSQGPQPLSWLPDSNHLVFINGKKVNIMEFDGTNITTVYAGPFVDSYVFPWSNGSRIVILTNLGNSDTLPNLYTISLK